MVIVPGWLASHCESHLVRSVGWLVARMVDIVIISTKHHVYVFLQADSESEFAFQGTYTSLTGDIVC